MKSTVVRMAVVAAAHTHSIYGKSLSALRRGLESFFSSVAEFSPQHW